MPNKLHNELSIWYRNYKISYSAPLNPNNFIMYIPRNWISDFGARRLANSEVISQVLFTPEHQAARETLKSIIFLLIDTDIVVLVAIYSTCVVYTKTIIHLGVGK